MTIDQNITPASHTANRRRNVIILPYNIPLSDLLAEDFAQAVAYVAEQDLSNDLDAAFEAAIAE
jgi:heat shock protein HspQ